VVYNSVRELGKPFTALHLESPVRSTGAGYLIEARPAQVDLTRFQDLVASGRDAARQDDLKSARADLDAGLALWRDDEPLRGLNCPQLTDSLVPSLKKLRRQARECWCDVTLRLGMPGEALAVLENLHEEDRLHEPVHELLVLALYRESGQNAATSAYRNIRAHMARETGSDPSARLRRLHQRVLNRDPDLDNPALYQLDE
jgi:DNA-binding SARP family transcriptional activator